ncbi:MAG: hypothetical protein ACRDLM_08665 [Gaiellaceae bacterium]
MKRSLLRVSVFVLVLAAVGAGSTSASLPRAKQVAVREALRLLAAYVPPHGAVRLRHLPTGDHLPLSTPGRIFGKHVDRHRVWLVHASVSDVEAYIQARLRGVTVRASSP